MQEEPGLVSHCHSETFDYEYLIVPNKLLFVKSVWCLCNVEYKVFHSSPSTKDSALEQFKEC